MTPELSRRFPIDRVGEGATFVVTPTEAEREAVAVRMGLVALPAFTCTFELRRAGRHGVRATGQLRAEAVQTCVVTLDPLEEIVSEDFAVRFVPAGTESDEVDLEAEDEIPFADGIIDLGEAAAEQLALALDPFPRRPDADLPPEATDTPEPRIVV